MKKGMIFALFLVLSIISMMSVYAINGEMKDSYQKGETILVKLGGTFLEPISKSNVEFIRGHVAVPFDYDVKKFGNDYYIWTIAPYADNSYTLKVKNISTYVNGVMASVNFESNFTVGGNNVDYSVKPGFVQSDKDFDMYVQYNLDRNMQINIDFAGNKQIVDLHPGLNDIKFSIDNIETSEVFNAQIGKYLVPMFIIVNGTSTVFPDDKPILVEPRKISYVFKYGVKGQYIPLVITNQGNGSINNIFINYPNEIFTSSYKSGDKFSLKANAKYYINFSLVNYSRSDIAEEFSINYGNESIPIPVEVSFAANESIKTIGNDSFGNYTTLNNVTDNSGYIHCYELSGSSICSADMVCSGEVTTTVEGQCCIGTCEAKGGGSYAWLGYLIVAIVIIAAVFVYFKYKKAKDSDPLKKRVEGIENKEKGP